MSENNCIIKLAHIDLTFQNQCAFPLGKRSSHRLHVALRSGSGISCKHALASIITNHRSAPAEPSQLPGCVFPLQGAGQMLYPSIIKREQGHPPVGRRQCRPVLSEGLHPRLPLGLSRARATVPSRPKKQLQVLLARLVVSKKRQSLCSDHKAGTLRGHRS